VRERKTEDLGFEDDTAVDAGVAGPAHQVVAFLELIVFLAQKGLIEREDVFHLHRLDAEVEAYL